jgi:aldose 1-epimerase
MKIDEGLLVLQYQQTRLTLDPSRGGAIRELSWRGQDVLRPTPADAGEDPFDTACFPMVPYVNRIAHGRFSFGGREVRLERNWTGDPHPLHGQGWRRAWDVIGESASEATLRFEGGANEWPWRYGCEQHFQVRGDGVSVELSIENLGFTPMPAMLGLHPYFPEAPRARLQARLPRVWSTDSGALPTEEARTPDDWSFEKGRAVDTVPLDHGFAGWDGVASLCWPDRTVTVRAPDCRFLHVYTPKGRDFFCIEPQSAPPGALTRNAAEATVVTPGERFAIRVDFSTGAS